MRKLLNFRQDVTHVRLGDFNYGSDKEAYKPLNMKVAQVILHPEYKKKSSYDNLALVHLDQSVDFSLNIRPACLPQMFNVTGETVSMTGWPFKLYSVPRSMRYKQDMTLRKYNMNPIDLEECHKIFAPHSIKGMAQGITDTQICASIVMEEDQKFFKIPRPLEVELKSNFILIQYYCSFYYITINCPFPRYSMVLHFRKSKTMIIVCIRFWDCHTSNQHSVY